MTSKCIVVNYDRKTVTPWIEARVISSTDPKKQYIVRISEKPSCTCPHYTFRLIKTMPDKCKHIDSVLDHFNMTPSNDSIMRTISERLTVKSEEEEVEAEEEIEVEAEYAIIDAKNCRIMLRIIVVEQRKKVRQERKQMILAMQGIHSSERILYKLEKLIDNNDTDLIIKTMNKYM
jgi:hypothetical protein